MRIELLGKTGEPVAPALRWLAAATGCLTTVTGVFVLGYWIALSSGSLIVGALVAGRFPRDGRALIRFGAGLVSLGLPAGIHLLLHTELGTDVRVTVSAAASVLLVVCCDIALVIEAIQMRFARRSA